MKEFSKYFDHTNLKQDASTEDIKKLCQEAKEYGFYAVCVNGAYVKTATEELAGSGIKVAAVVGFPLGCGTTLSKVNEAVLCCEDGADEIDMVINAGALKEGRNDYVRDEIAIIVACADEYNATVKVILETCLLNAEEIKTGCRLAVEAGATFVKTSTGFGKGGATAEHIKMMRAAVGNMAQIKAAGGIRDLKKARDMIEVGADRIGTSATVAIMQEAEKENM